ncbi:hypothetical protein [Halegenticoccus tardaugens]|nr:hypothetical protein [Halegenticoccus tardaugens]
MSALHTEFTLPFSRTFRVEIYLETSRFPSGKHRLYTESAFELQRN